MKKELGIFIGLFLFLAIGMHFKQWIDHPIQHIMDIHKGGGYGIPGITHPLVFTLIFYSIVAVIRIIVNTLSKK